MTRESDSYGAAVGGEVVGEKREIVRVAAAQVPTPSVAGSARRGSLPNMGQGGLQQTNHRLRASRFTLHASRLSPIDC